MLWDGVVFISNEINIGTVIISQLIRLVINIWLGFIEIFFIIKFPFSVKFKIY